MKQLAPISVRRDERTDMNLQTLIDIVGPDGVLTGDDVRARSVS